MWQVDFIHKLLCTDAADVYQLSCHPFYLLLAKLLLMSCNEFSCDLQVCVLEIIFDASHT